MISAFASVWSLPGELCLYQDLLQACGAPPGRILRAVPAPQLHSSGLSLVSLQESIPQVLFTPTQVSSLMECYFLAAALGWCPAGVWQSHVYMAYG